MWSLLSYIGFVLTRYFEFGWFPTKYWNFFTFVEKNRFIRWNFPTKNVCPSCRKHQNFNVFLNIRNSEFLSSFQEMINTRFRHPNIFGFYLFITVHINLIKVKRHFCLIWNLKSWNNLIQILAALKATYISAQNQLPFFKWLRLI